MSLTLFSAFSKNTFASIEINENKNKLYLIIAPAPGPKGRKYDWDKKMAFSLEHHEILTIRKMIRIALDNGPEAAQVECEKLFGRNKNATFTHRKNEMEAYGGVEFKQSQMQSYAPFDLMVKYRQEGNGEPRSLRCPLMRSTAEELYYKLDRYIDIAISRPIEMAIERGEQRRMKDVEYNNQQTQTRGLSGQDTTLSDMYL